MRVWPLRGVLASAPAGLGATPQRAVGRARCVKDGLVVGDQSLELGQQISPGQSPSDKMSQDALEQSALRRLVPVLIDTTPSVFQPSWAGSPSACLARGQASRRAGSRFYIGMPSCSVSAASPLLLFLVLSHGLHRPPRRFATHLMSGLVMIILDGIDTTSTLHHRFHHTTH